MKKTRKKRGCFIAVQVQGPMKHHAYLGAFPSYEKARYVADENTALTGKRTRVINGMTGIYEGEE